MFNVSDLKPGMLVKLVNGKYGVIIPISSGLAIIGRYDDEMSILTSDIRVYSNLRNNTDYCVIEVYDVAYSNSADFFMPGTRKCLWKYNDIKEMTMEEIEKSTWLWYKNCKKH